jgi:TRAP transporter 4TM/12TM fusion protein
MSDATEISQRSFFQKLILLTGVAASLFHLYFSTIGLMSTIAVRSGHLIFAMVLIFLTYPAVSKFASRSRTTRGLVRAFDLFLAALAVTAGMYIIIIYPEMNQHLGNLTVWDKALGVVMVLLTLEITRRTIGNTLTIIAVVFLAYAYFGRSLPGFLVHRGFSWERIVSQMYCTLEGIYGTPIGVMATYVFLFVLFGAFLQNTGATDFFIDLAYSLTGQYVGGPAKTAVLASGLMGSVSGSAIANVVTTGCVTIPLMKNVGYKPEVAGGIEAAASTGGQIMPPLMGAGVFIMAEFTGIPYLKIMLLSIIPAILYYFTVWVFAHNAAVAQGLKGLPKDQLPDFKATLKKGYICLVPLALLIFLLVIGYSPTLSASYATLLVYLMSFLRRETRMSFSKLLETMEMAAKMAVSISAACAAAGLIVGVVGITGLGLKFSGMVLSVAGGNLFLALILVLLASLVLGMGLPVTASYIMLAVLAAPALLELGVPLLAGHLIIFWYSQDANVTPPVCLAGYAAAGIAGSNPFRTGMQGWKLAKGLYLIPLLFAYQPEILFTNGFWPAMAVTATGFIAMAAGVGALDGYLVVRLAWPLRVMLALIAVAIFLPNNYLSAGGSALFLAFWYLMKKRRKKALAAGPPAGSAPLAASL